MTGILFLLLAGTGASAAGRRTLTAGCPSRCSEKIEAAREENGLCLSLPGAWDLTAITLEMEGIGSFRLGDDPTLIPAGTETDLTGKTGTRTILKDEKGEALAYLTILQGSDIPALFLEVDAKELKKVNADRKISITEGRAVFMEANGSVSYDGRLAQLKSRGNATFQYSKKPYQFKLAEKTSLCGMNKAKTWILLANWLDISLLRNQIVLDLSREIGLRYAVGCEQTDVWINGSYNGLYLLTEKIQIGSARIDITDLEEATEEVNDSPFDPGALEKKRHDGFQLFRSYPAVKDPEDITGGYIMTIEKNFRMQVHDMAGFRTEHYLNIRIREPTYPSKAQTEYLGALITEMQDALLADDGICPETGKSYREYLDVDSFARKFLIEDWCKNYDFLGGSQYMYKDSDRADPLIYAGPAWDYDLSFGSMKDRGLLTTGRYLTNFKQENNIYWLLYKHSEFSDLVRKLWQGTFRPALAVLLGEAPAREGGYLRSFDEYLERITPSAVMNFRKWGVEKKRIALEIGGNFRNAVSYLERWLRQHTKAMDEVYGSGQN